MPGRSFSSPDYRYGFNGMEKEGTDWTGNDGSHLDFGARIYDSRIARFMSVDPLTSEFSFWGPYLFAGNNPIKYIDVYGMGPGGGPFTNSSFIDNGIVILRMRTSDRIAMETVKVVAENVNLAANLVSVGVHLFGDNDDGVHAIGEMAEIGVEKGANAFATGTVVEKALDVTATSVSNYGDVLVDVKTTKVLRPGFKTLSKGMGKGFIVKDVVDLVNSSAPTRMEVLMEFTYDVADGNSKNFNDGVGYQDISNDGLFRVKDGLFKDQKSAEDWMNNMYQLIDNLLPEGEFDLTTDEGKSKGLKLIKQHENQLQDIGNGTLSDE